MAYSLPHNPATATFLGGTDPGNPCALIGVIVNVGQGPDGGWYFTVAVADLTGDEPGPGELWSSDGPYEEENEARACAQVEALQYLTDHEVSGAADALARIR
jgi:hypothetical protein